MSAAAFPAGLSSKGERMLIQADSEARVRAEARARFDDVHAAFGYLRGLIGERPSVDGQQLANAFVAEWNKTQAQRWAA